MVVEANANVRARVTAHEVIVDGELSGEVFCLGRTRISRTWRVVGDMSTEKIVLDEGPYFEGRLEMPTALRPDVGAVDEGRQPGGITKDRSSTH